MGGKQVSVVEMEWMMKAQQEAFAPGCEGVRSANRHPDTCTYHL